MSAEEARDIGYSGAGRRCERSRERSGVGEPTRGGGQHGCGKRNCEARLAVGQYAAKVYRLLCWSLHLLLLLRNPTRNNVSSSTLKLQVTER